MDYQYTSYDSVSNILTKTTEHGNYVYDYDDVYRLTDADNPTLDDEAYTYDGVGNRETASGVTGSITHNTNNELTVYGEIEYTYDDNGNMIRKSIGSAAVNYIYNVENRLIRVEDELTLLVPDPRSADGTIERDPRDGHGGGCPDHGGDVRVNLGVQGHHCRDDLDLVGEAKVV